MVITGPSLLKDVHFGIPDSGGKLSVKPSSLVDSLLG